MNKKLKIILIERDMSITDLAKKVGITRSWLSLVLNGHHKSYHTRIKISRLLNISYEELWEQDANDERQAA